MNDLARVLRWIRPYWRQEVLLFGLLLLGAGAGLAAPFVIGWIVDHVFVGENFDKLPVLAVILLLILALVFGPGYWVRRVLTMYSEPADRYAMTGGELARRLLDAHGLPHVGVEVTEDGDHYDPMTKTVRLTADKLDSGSLTAITVAAHEVGHAIQDKVAYVPLRLRSQLVRVAMPVERLGALVLMLAPVIGLVTRVPKVGALMFVAGFLTLATSTVVHLVTLPTEFDASFGRALPILEEHQILKEYDRKHARRLLTAAALTYVSASLMSLLNIARWWAIVRR